MGWTIDEEKLLARKHFLRPQRKRLPKKYESHFKDLLNVLSLFFTKFYCNNFNVSDFPCLFTRILFLQLIVEFFGLIIKPWMTNEIFFFFLGSVGQHWNLRSNKGLPDPPSTLNHHFTHFQWFLILKPPFLLFFVHFCFSKKILKEIFLSNGFL